MHDIAPVKDGDQWFLLYHYLMITWDHARRGSIQLFGHVHNNWQGSRNSINAGVDVWDTKPLQAGEILHRAASQPVSKHWADVEPE